MNEPGARDPCATASAESPKQLSLQANYSPYLKGFYSYPAVRASETACSSACSRQDGFSGVRFAPQYTRPLGIGADWSWTCPARHSQQAPFNGLSLPARFASHITHPATSFDPAANGKPKRRRVPTMAQRRAANIRERRRMFNLNEAFDTLRKRVPTFAYEKRLSRIETLRLAITYIAFMTDLVNGKEPEKIKLQGTKTLDWDTLQQISPEMVLDGQEAVAR